MTQAPVRPRYRPMPEGFVDAIGLDDDAIAVKPYILGATAEAAAANTQAEPTKAAAARRPRRRRARAAPAHARTHDHDFVMGK